jgi:4-hydroxybenzoate polyprenyltransferase
VSGTVYIVNDLADVQRDRQHPEKRHRPIAAGKVSAGAAAVATAVLLLVTLPLSFVLDVAFGTIVVGYLLLQVAYSFALKHVVIIDVMLIATGFLLRVAAGVPLSEAQRFSPWLYVCMTMLALLIGFGKRRHELVLLKENANVHRQSLQEYNLSLLDHVISIVTSSTLLAYTLYTFSSRDGQAPNPAMMLTIPFPLYAIFRYLYLMHVKGMGGAPEEIVFSDRPLQAAVGLWGLCVITVLYVLQ